MSRQSERISSLLDELRAELRFELLDQIEAERQARREAYLRTGRQELSELGSESAQQGRSIESIQSEAAHLTLLQSGLDLLDEPQQTGGNI